MEAWCHFCCQSLVQFTSAFFLGRLLVLIQLIDVGLSSLSSSPYGVFTVSTFQEFGLFHLSYQIGGQLVVHNKKSYFYNI